MNKYSFLTFFFLLIFYQGMHAQGGVWVYWKGTHDNLSSDSGHYGTMGVPNAANVPPGRYQCAYWQDLKGNYWIFGGYNMNCSSDLNDLWMYSPKTNMWTWMNGPQRSSNTAGNWGTQGVPSTTNCPTARGYGANCMTDKNGDLWLYGGSGGFNDLWRYHIATNEWTWIAGEKTGSGVHHGTMGVASAANTPGDLGEVKSGWVDSLSNLWMFGGNSSNDLWKFDVSINEWTWMKGDSPTISLYGALGVEKANSIPTGRCSYTKWKDSKGDLYIFAGSTSSGCKNDVWKYNIKTNNWVWMGGDSMAGDSGHYIKQCEFGHNNMPCARYENQTAQNLGCSQTFWTFGGFSGCSKYSGVYNDLWLYNISSNKWNWVYGKPESDSGHYGPSGKALSTNAIGSRGGVGTWTDSLNNLWVFGGYNYNFSSTLNDIWEFIPDTSCIPSKYFTPAGNIPLPSDTIHCAWEATYLNTKGIRHVHVTPDDGSFALLGNGDSAIFRPSKTTTYTITYGEGGACSGSGTISLTVHVKGGSSDFMFSDSATTLLSPLVHLFNNSGNKGAKYEWIYNGQVYSRSIDTSVLFGTAGTHCFTLVAIDTSHYHCNDTVTHCVKVVDSAIILVPTAFSPNGDGVNDYFRIIYGDKIQIKAFEIFNRWGQLVYSSTTKPWDGTFNGQPAETGTYVYFIEAENTANNKHILKKGAILLVR